jgi:hypothetical protein
MTMELVAQQFLRALRGKRSQRAFARRLGYRGNPITDWEHGRHFPTARVVLAAAMRVKVDVVQACARFAPGSTLALGAGGFAVGAWLRQVCGTTSIVELSARSGLSRSAIGRWLAEQRHPRLPEFFRLVDVATGRLPDLVAELVPIAHVPALKTRHQAAQAARRIAFDEPWSELILVLLGVAPLARRKAPAALARRLGISRARAARALALLQKAALVRIEGSRYVSVKPLTVDTRGKRKETQAQKLHWALVVADRLRAPREHDLSAYNVLSATEHDLERIRALLHATFREIRAIVAASEPADRVALLNLQLLDFNAPAAEER